LRYRRQILALKRYFTGRGCTVLLLDDRTGEGHDLQLQSIAHGVVLLENLPRDFGVKRRRLEVRKLRGSRFREGFHDFTIETGGVEVFPRLIASEHATSIKRGAVPSGLDALDALMGGGIDTGTSTLLMGPAGCGKSTIALRYVLSAAERGDAAAIFAFDEAKEVLLDRAVGLGLDLRPHIQSGKVRVYQVDPAELSPGEFVQRVRQGVEIDGAKLVVIDSLNGFLLSMPAERQLTAQLHELIAFLNHLGVATLMTLAQTGFFGAMGTPVDVSYLADSVLLLRYFEASGEVRQAISAVKKRTGAHERTIRELRFEDGGLTIGKPLTQFEGVLTGIPKFLGNDAKLGHRGED
jgi:circadian clock protein KaiC